jgi:prepilin-type N-terminal cleavage/methylation domain-containing protein
MNRRGYTLMEMMIVVAMSAIAIAISSQILVTVWRTSAALREQRQATDNITRLARQFRDDAHAAERADVGPDCVFALGKEHAVRYAAHPQGVSRYETRGEAILMELYTLPQRTQLEMESLNITDTPFVQLSLRATAAANASHHAVAYPLVIRARVGTNDVTTVLKPQEQP